MPSQRPRILGALVAFAVIVTLAAGLLIGALWLAQRSEQNGIDALARTGVDASTLPQTIPFRYVAGHIVVDVVFGLADGRVPLILDTGAPTILSAELIERLGWEVAGALQTAAIDGSVESSDVVTVPQLRIGDAIFRDVGAIKGFVEPDNPLSCISADGVLGANLMKAAVWQIDYAAREITIAESSAGLDHVDGALVLGFSAATEASPSPLAALGVGDASIVFLVDTGSDGGLTVHPADLAAVGLEVGPEGPAFEVMAASVAGTYDARVLYHGADVHLHETYQLNDYPVATIESLQEGQGNIGNAFLEDFVVTIDWPSGVLYLDPTNGDPHPPLPMAATLGWDGERVIVGSVVEGSAAQVSGLQVGDLVAMVGARDVAAATRDEFCELSIAQHSAPFEITTDDGTSHVIGRAADFFE